MSPLQKLVPIITRIVINELAKSRAARQLNERAQQHFNAGVQKAVESSFYHNTVHWIKQLPKLPKAFIDEIKKDINQKK